MCLSFGPIGKHILIFVTSACARRPGARKARPLSACTTHCAMGPKRRYRCTSTAHYVPGIEQVFVKTSWYLAQVVGACVHRNTTSNTPIRIIRHTHTNTHTHTQEHTYTNTPTHIHKHAHTSTCASNTALEDDAHTLPHRQWHGPTPASFRHMLAAA